MSSIFPHPCLNAPAIRCKTRIPSVPRTRSASARARASSELFTKVPNLDISHVEQQVEEIVVRQSRRSPAVDRPRRRPELGVAFLKEAYERCRCVCEEYGKTYYLGTRLMTEERQKAIWAIYTWCKRTDELVDGPNAALTDKVVLDRWEERLHEIFEGRPYDMLDAALADTVYKFPIDIKPFMDMIEGMRMDTRKSRYHSFQELYQYCYYAGGTVGLMSVPVMGIAPESHASLHKIYNAALHLGIGNQLTNILRDVGEDALRGRVYLPQDELAQFELSDEDILSRRVTDQWRDFMKEQIARARFYFDQAEGGASQLSKVSRWPVWAALLLYREILDAIEDNNYDNLSKRAYVGRTKKLLMLPWAFARSGNMPNMSSTSTIISLNN